MNSLPKVDLMQPTLVSKPFHRPGWVYEEKYDGWRVAAHKEFNVARGCGLDCSDEPSEVRTRTHAAHSDGP